MKMKMTRARRHEAAHIRRLLAERFPDCFAAKGGPKRPLKIGIHRDLITAAPDLMRYQIIIALTDYTGGLTYLDAMTAGAPRIGLDGAPAGEVDDRSAVRAASQASRIRANNARQAQQPAPAEAQP